jgi:pyruvate/2-oxoglutarate dehydrogenase complex dihydrolipoamide acyltransferase (E2) component
MGGGSDGRRVVPWPVERRLVTDTLAIGRRKPMIHGLLEVDVGEPRRRLRAHAERSGERLSFTAFLLTCFGRAVAENPRVHACRDWRGRLVLFDDVDVTTIVEVSVPGSAETFPLAHVVRATNRRDVFDVSAELRRVQADPTASPSGRRRRPARLVARLPGPLRRLVWRAALASPGLLKANAGTAAVTSVGMFAGGGAFAIGAATVHNLALVVGGIVARPVLRDGTLVEREHLQLTISFDHDVVDGGPAARFGTALSARIERADGLPEG